MGDKTASDGSRASGSLVFVASNSALKFLMTVAIPNFTLTNANLFERIALKFSWNFNLKMISPHSNAISRTLAERHESHVRSLCWFFSRETFGIKSLGIFPVTFVVMNRNVGNEYLTSLWNDVLWTRNLIINGCLSHCQECGWIFTQCF